MTARGSDEQREARNVDVLGRERTGRVRYANRTFLAAVTPADVLLG